MNFKAGQKVKIVASTSGHGYGIGKICIVGTVNNTNNTLTIKNGSGSYLYPADVVALSVTREELEKEKEDLKNQLDDINAKLTFLDETGESELDSEVSRCYTALKTLDSNASDLEKAKKIADLFRG